MDRDMENFYGGFQTGMEPHKEVILKLYNAVRHAHRLIHDEFQ